MTADYEGAAPDSFLANLTPDERVMLDQELARIAELKAAGQWDPQDMDDPEELANYLVRFSGPIGADADGYIVTYSLGGHIDRVAVAAKILAMTNREVVENSEELTEHGLTRAWSNVRGGGGIVVATDGSYLLFSCTTDPAEALADFLAGRRTSD